MPPRKSNLGAQVPVIRFVETPELSSDQIPDVLREINDRQWGCVLQVLFEAKYKAEAMLHNDEVMNQHGKVAFYQGWIAYANYILGSLAGLRAQQTLEIDEPREGPET